MRKQVEKEHCRNCDYFSRYDSICTIRNQKIDSIWWTYCMNHPHYNSNKVMLPMGPVYDFLPQHQQQGVIYKSEDTAEIRDMLLEQALQIQEVDDYNSIELRRDTVIVWQLGEFMEMRALAIMNKIRKFSHKVNVTPPAVVANCTRQSLIEEADVAFYKLIHPIRRAV